MMIEKSMVTVIEHPYRVYFLKNYTEDLGWGYGHTLTDSWSNKVGDKVRINLRTINYMTNVDEERAKELILTVLEDERTRQAKQQMNAEQLADFRRETLKKLAKAVGDDYE